MHESLVGLPYYSVTWKLEGDSDLSLERSVSAFGTEVAKWLTAVQTKVRIVRSEVNRAFHCIELFDGVG